MRKAFTLVELLVVMFVISVLIAILMPAVQGVREGARQITCTNNQKQLALGLQHYENIRGSLPGWREFTTVTPPQAGVAAPGDYESGDEITAQTSWVFAILPYVEQTDMFDRLKNGDVVIGTLLTPIPLLNCPSFADNANLEDEPRRRAMTYVVNAGAVDNLNPNDTTVVDISIANGPFLDRAGITAAGVGGNYRYTRGGFLLETSENSKYRNTVVRLSDISRMGGTAYTLMTSENTQRGFWISEDFVHFYNDRSGNRLRAITSGDWFRLPDLLDGRYRWALRLTGFVDPADLTVPPFTDTIEGSVGFCWPRTGRYTATNVYQTYYPLAADNVTGNAKQGFIAVQTDQDPTSAYENHGRPRVPCYLGMYSRKTFDGSWYQSARPASFHAGGVVVSAFCDGNVRRISTSIDEVPFVQMMTSGAAQSDAGWQFPVGPAYPQNFLYGKLFDAGVL